MDIKQSVLNIETLGHIDHGKTSLTRMITGIWTDRHSESIKRNMTIKLGYADAVIRKCEECEGSEAYTVKDKCDKCGGDAIPLIRISMIDAPGHETLMATAIAGASVIDAVLFVIAANEPCPMQQTREHLMIMNLLGIKNVIIVQTKIDIVGKDKAIANYKQIKEFIKGSVIENSPIIPVMTNRGINIDVLLKKITELQRPKHDIESPPIMYVVRSFDVNKPGTKPKSLVGGILGGAVIKGKFKIGDEIEIRPGINISENEKKKEYKPAITKISSMNNGSENIEEALPGGLIGLSTEIDPMFVKADSMVGNLVGHVGKLPDVVNSISFSYKRINRPDMQEPPIHENEALILGVGTATIVGYVVKSKKDTINVELNHPVCMEKHSKIAILRNIGKRWRLTGYAISK